MANVNETMDLVKAAQANPQMVDAITKSFTQGTGLVAYDLEAPAKLMVPVLTPLRNMTPRVKSNAGDTATRWKAITAINTTNIHAGVSEGNRGAVISDAVADLTASYIGLGLENTATFESDYASESFDDVKARAVQNLLNSLMIKEEDTLLGGNSSVALGKCATPVTAPATTGGTVADGSWVVVVVPLSYDGFRRSSLAAGVPMTISRTNADSSVDTINAGCGIASDEAAATVSGGTNHGSIAASVTAIKGAVGYAWYVGTTGAAKLEAITTVNHVLITALLGTGQTATHTVDRSRQNGYAFDGFLYSAFGTASAYYKALATGTPGTGTKLTADGKGGVVEINDVLGAYWDNLKLQPDAIWANRAQINDITSRCVGSSTSPFRFNLSAGTAQGSLVGGGKVTEYQSPVDSSIIPLNIHPNMPAGTIMFTVKNLPYALNNVGDVFRIKARREYYQIEWPLRTRKYEYGCYVDEVFQHMFPVSLGILTNIAAG
jgi:hypothetical protein